MSFNVLRVNAVSALSCGIVTPLTSSKWEKRAFGRIIANGRKKRDTAIANVLEMLKGSHTRAHTPKQGCFGRGLYHHLRTVSHVSETLRGQGAERRTLPLLGLGRVCSRRTQKAFGTAMRLCASLSRGVAAPLGCVIFLQFGDVAVFSLCAQYFLNVRGGGYHYPQCALRVVETLDGRLSKRLTCRFFGLTGSSLIPVAQKQKRHLTANSPDPRERNRSCFCVTSWSVPGTRRSARGCRWRRGRSGHRPRPG